MTVENKVVVVTGASSGIGASTVKLLVKGGAKVVFGARRQEKLEEVASGLDPDQIAFQETDVTDYQQVKSLVQLAVDRFGKVDALFNNAGIMPMAAVSEDNRDEWQQMLNINVMGVLNGISAVLPIMHRQGYGHILATDSLAGYKVYPNLAVYCGTKFAVRAILEGVRQEEIKNKIRTTLIAPGMVETELYKSISDPKTAKNLVDTWHEENHALKAEDIADLVVYAIGLPNYVSINEVKIRPSVEL
ncbi:SDR family oxidoreductase [Oenococcus alcoholitolerans]|uniref:SDR family oxidoreductase n=1 Tax=Oenococcus alcoholitolerans TaxID=931074 RepID=UPI003F6FEF8A